VFIHICCKHMFQLFHLVSVCCSRCCSPRALTCEHARAARTHPALPISIMQASSNSRTCTQRTVSAQMAEHFLVKVHACMQSVRAGQHPTDAEPDALYHQGWSPTVKHAAGVDRDLHVLCSHPLSHMQFVGLTHMLRCVGAAAVRADSGGVGASMVGRRSSTPGCAMHQMSER
jgi:hypothetical protein